MVSGPEECRLRLQGARGLLKGGGGRLDHLLARFAESAQQPLEHARQWKAQTNRRVIGSFPMHFPGELAHASGALPLLLQEGEDQITVGLGSMFPFYCGYTRSVVDQALKGEYAFLDAIMFGDHCVQLLGAADAIRCSN